MTSATTATTGFDDASPKPEDAYPHASKFDRVGIFASLACAVHCLVAPFLLLLLPAAGSIWAHPSVHWIVAALVLPLALVVVFRGYRLHRRRSAVVAAVMGAVFILAGLVVPMHASLSSAATLHFGDAPAAAEATCNEACCPSVAVDAQTGAMSLTMPPGSLVTIIGSVLLITAHGINLYGCRCYSRTRGPEGGACGCASAC